MDQPDGVLVTGARGGIGTAIVERLTRDGVPVVAAYRPGSAPTSSEGVIAIEMDVASEESVIQGFAAIDNAGVGLRGAVTAAGVNQRAAALECSSNIFMENLSVNLLGTFLVCREAAKRMQDKGGSIVTISSTMAMAGSNRRQAPYSASKGGVVALTRALAVEWAELGIRVNSVAPTFISTPMNQPVLQQPELAEAIRAGIPMGRFGEPMEVAEAVWWLLDDSSSFVTGHVLAVDGGYLAI